MINIYKDIKDDEGNIIKGRTKLFLNDNDILDDGGINTFSSGIVITPETTGIMFIVDDYLIDQINKVKLINNQLVLKDGEEIVPPVKTDLEIEEEKLEKRLAALRAKKEANNIE